MRKSVSFIWIVLALIAATGGPANAGGGAAMADPLAEARAELALRPHAGDEVWRTLTASGLPIIQPDPQSPGRVRATFLFRAAAGTRSVRFDSVINAVEVGGLVGDYVRDFTLPMNRLPGTDIWWITLAVPAETTAVYSFLAARGEQVRRYSDIANPRRLRGADAESVFMAAPAATDPAIRPLAPGDRQPPQAFTLDSAALGRTVFLQRLSLAGADAESPVLVIYDSFLWGVRAPAWEIAQNLVNAARIPPVHLILIDQLDPDSAGRAYADQADFLGVELAAALDERGLRGEMILAGASRRGLAVSIAGLRYPEQVSAVISMSGSFYWSPAGEAPEWLTRNTPAAGDDAPRFILSAGELETVRTTTNRGSVMLQANARMRETLLGAGYQADLHVYAGGHDVAGWRGALAAALTRIFDSAE